MRPLVLAALIGCTAPNITVAPEPPPAAELRVETWEVMLRSTYEVALDARLPAVATSLRETPDDVDAICVTGVGTDERRTKLLAEVAQRWPYVGFVKTTAGTKPFDERDLLGAVRAPPTTPACTSADDLATFELHYGCLREKCVRADGTLDLACGYPSCGSVLPRFGWRCAGCMDTSSSWLPVAKWREQCTVKPRGELARDGEIAALILSRRPLRDVRAHVLPTTFEPRGAVSATLDVGTTPVTLYCSEMNLGLYDPAADYPGVYGAPFSGSEGFLAEHQLGLERTIERVFALGRAQPTVMLGHSYFLWEIDKTTGEAEPQTPYWMFGGNLQPLVSPSAELCTRCVGKNAHNKTGKSTFESAAFASATRPVTASDVMLTRDEPRATIAGKAMPASAFFGVRFTLRLP